MKKAWLWAVVVRCAPSVICIEVCEQCGEKLCVYHTRREAEEAIDGFWDPAEYKVIKLESKP